MDDTPVRPNLYKTGFTQEDFINSKHQNPDWVIAVAIRESDLLQKDEFGRTKAGTLVKPSVSDSDPSRAAIFKIIHSTHPIHLSGDYVLVINQAVNQLMRGFHQFGFPTDVIITNFGPSLNGRI